MKISFDIECTPVEARAFLGLPDLAPLHELYIERMTGLLTEGMGPADVERMTRTWLPGISEGMEAWRQAMFNMARPKTD